MPQAGGGRAQSFSVQAAEYFSFTELQIEFLEALPIKKAEVFKVRSERLFLGLTQVSSGWPTNAAIHANHGHGRFRCWHETVARQAANNLDALQLQ